MSPSDLEVLIHCYCCPEPHPRLRAPAVDNALRRFRSAGVIVAADATNTIFMTTPLGSAWLAAILATPIPKITYLDASGNPINPL